MTLDEQLERAQADGRITTGDADEVRRFADFLTDLGAAGVPAQGEGRTLEQQQAFLAVWREHYPEDYADQWARTCTITVDVAYGDGHGVACTPRELRDLWKLADYHPAAALARARAWSHDPGRLRYGPVTTPTSPGGGTAQP